MSLLDFVTGGKSSAATDAINKAEAAYANLKSPTVEQLTLPQLQQYVNDGLMTPAQAKAYLQNNNALETENVGQTGTQAQIEALNQLSRVADAGVNGTPEEQAQVAKTESDFNRSVGGQRGAIEQAMQARGIPSSLIAGALENQQVGQDATNANLADLQAQSNAYHHALEAMSGRAAAGSNLQGQQNTQANTVAQAQNAMQQFNAANQQATSSQNANLAQQAGSQNAQTKQNTSNANTETSNERTKYNAQLPEMVFQNEATKAAGEAGAFTNAAELAQQQGKQTAGIASGLLGTAGTVIGAGYGGPVGAMIGNKVGTTVGGGTSYAAHGMIAEDAPCYDEGGMIPGHASVPGDSMQNDHVHAMVSPGEAVLPRTAVMRHMPEILSMLAESKREPEVHPQDVQSLLMAMKSMRMGGHHV